MAIRSSALLLIGALAACEPSTGDGKDVAPTPVDRTDSEASEPSEFAPEKETLALCSEANQNSGDQIECVIDSADGSGLLLEVSYGGESAGVLESPVTVRVMSQDGALIQTIEEPAESFYSRPNIQDLDMDGRGDLLVPLYTGNVNTVYAIWHGKAGDTPFARAGEVSGIGIDTHLDGLFSVPARSSAASWEKTYYKIKDSKLVEIAVMSTELNMDGSTESCIVSDAGGLGMTGLTLEEAQTKFCAEE